MSFEGTTLGTLPRFTIVGFSRYSRWNGVFQEASTISSQYLKVFATNISYEKQVVCELAKSQKVGQKLNFKLVNFFLWFRVQGTE